MESDFKVCMELDKMSVCFFPQASQSFAPLLESLAAAFTNILIIIIIIFTIVIVVHHNFNAKSNDRNNITGFADNFLIGS